MTPDEKPEPDEKSDEDVPEKKPDEDTSKEEEDDDDDDDDDDESDAFDNVDPLEKDKKADAEDDPFGALRKSWGFPSFARDFPADPELATLVAAFAAGDYATVRSGAPALEAKTTDDAVKRAAAVLRARIEPDPTSRLFFGLTAALMVFLMVWWATHDGAQPIVPVAKPAPTVEYVK